MVVLTEPSQGQTPLASTKPPSKSEHVVPIVGTKEKPISAFAAFECSSREDLAKLCFMMSPMPAAASSSSSNVSLTGTDCSVATDHGHDHHQSQLYGAPTVHFQFSNKDMVTDTDASLELKNTAPMVTALEMTAPDKPSASVVSAAGSEASVTEKPCVAPAADASLALPTQVRCTTKSRVGRENQRYETCPETGELIRVTTGCVPITNDGCILFVSSARKREWILPKGGWEKDEKLEESALRETYEESGVLGTLGPLLSDVTYETRKGRKRRLEEMSRKTAEDMLLTVNKESKRSSALGSSDQKASSFLLPIVNIAAIPEKIGRPDYHPNFMSGSASLASVTSFASSEDEEHAFTRARELAQLLSEGKKEEDVGPPKPKASLCKMKMFPMYVSEVLDSWPENGRTRKVVPLDEAIELASRAEIKQVLLEIKRRNLHLPLQSRGN
jgi:hypothetical protein